MGDGSSVLFGGILGLNGLWAKPGLYPFLTSEHVDLNQRLSELGHKKQNTIIFSLFPWSRSCLHLLPRLPPVKTLSRTRSGQAFLSLDPE